MDKFTECLQAVDNATSRVLGDPFYRGHGHVSWRLLPTLLRHGRSHMENAFYHSFVSYAGDLLSESNSSWDNLFVMRHHGVFTRLLDWTESFGVAVYFALKEYRKATPEKQREDPPVVWILNPGKMTMGSRFDGGVVTPESDFSPGYYLEAFVEGRETPFEDAIPLYPPLRSKRMLAQRACFTMHGRNTAPLEEQCPNCLDKIVIPREAVSEAKRFLELAGIDEYALFPDLDGLGRLLVEKLL